MIKQINKAFRNNLNKHNILISSYDKYATSKGIYDSAALLLAESENDNSDARQRFIRNIGSDDDVKIRLLENWRRRQIDLDRSRITMGEASREYQENRNLKNISQRDYNMSMNNLRCQI